MENELWKPVVGYEKYYQVSTLGRVKSLRSGNILKPFKHSQGYQRVSLFLSGKANNVGIHQLVAKAFIINREFKNAVNHINGNKADNRVHNLEWCTPLENTTHARRIGLNSGWPNRRVIDNESGIIYKSIRIAAKAIGMNESTLTCQIRGRNKNTTSLTYYTERADHSLT